MEPLCVTSPSLQSVQLNSNIPETYKALNPISLSSTNPNYRCVFGSTFLYHSWHGKSPQVERQHKSGAHLMYFLFVKDHCSNIGIFRGHQHSVCSIQAIPHIMSAIFLLLRSIPFWGWTAAYPFSCWWNIWIVSSLWLFKHSYTSVCVSVCFHFLWVTKKGIGGL